MYNLGIVLYAFIIRVASIFHRKARLLIRGQHATWGILKEKIKKEEQYIWVHASSLGEFEQGRPLIEKIKKDYPMYKILLTFFSPSGYEVRKDYPLVDVVCYLPFDTRLNTYRFFQLVRPKKALFIKYEFWPNYFMRMKHYGIELYSVSSIFRPTQLFFRSYGQIARLILSNVTWFFVQDERSQKLLDSIGLKNTSVVGDTRFDRVKQIMLQSKALPLVESFVKSNESAIRYTLVAGSSWPKDEDLLIEYFNKHQELRLIIAPHEIYEEHINEIISKLKRPYARYTQTSENSVAQADCLIVDCFGVLSSIYRYGKVAYIGGGFGVGIHNIVEAAVYGMPLIFGPKYDKFREAIDILRAGGAHSICDYNELNDLLDRYYDVKEIEKDGTLASQYVADNLGATDQIIAGLSL